MDPKETPQSESTCGIQETGETDRLADPVDGEQPPRLPFTVVGIGASAGGLEAFVEFLKALAPDTGMAFVFIQHLPPDRESLLTEILSRHTTMPVLQVESGMEVRPNHLYIIRPGHTLTMHEGRLHLGARLELPQHRRPVDDFFRSLAEEQRERGVAVVMSGMGSNGSAGAQAIKAVGGIVIAQDPESSKFPSMPRSLIDTGLADFILRPQDIPEVLVRYSSHPYTKAERSAEELVRLERQYFTEVLTLLRTRTRHDFTGYKTPTVVRRIQRRMGLNQITQLGDYARSLRQSPTEVMALADDLMIHVTGFFRDPEAWETLRGLVIWPLLAEREDGGQVRCWVTACSSGEEAYTLAMLIVEAAENVGKKFDVKIFATDTAARSLAHARAGIYPNGIESDVTPERLERFFEKDDATYRVKRALREMVVFAPQNVMQDPPFSRLDVCTCRNLLIYLQPEVQERVLTLLHFGLRENGALFLGTSETVACSDELFEPIEKKWRIYRRVGPTRHGSVDFPMPPSLAARQEAERGENGSGLLPRGSLALTANRELLERYTPPAVVVDRHGRVCHFHGDTGRFLVQPPGEPTRDLMAMARETLRGPVRRAFQEALARNAAHVARDGFLETEGGRFRVEITVAPLEVRNGNGGGYVLVTFDERPEPEPVYVPRPEGRPAGEYGLEEELRRVREELQSTIEELQTSNEEMKASNEEVTSVNEELQSTNEELETSKEELQSYNEEMSTVNAQLQHKADELEQATNDLASLLSSTDIAVLFLDSHFRIRRYTPAVQDLLDVIPSDVGRPLKDLSRKFEDPHLIEDARRVLERLVPIEKEVTSESGRIYIRRALPYRTGDNRINGIVITFVDVTERFKAVAALRESDERHRLVLEGVKEYAILMLDPGGHVTVWNTGAERILGYREQEVLGRETSLFFTPEDRAAGVPQFEMRQAELSGHANDDRWHVRKDGTRFWASGIMSVVRAADGTVRGFVKVLRDNTDRKMAEDALEAARVQAEAASDAKDQFLATVSHELRTPLSAILLWGKLLRSRGLEPSKESAEALESILRSAEAQRQLIEDLLDMSRITSGRLRLTPRDADVIEILKSAVGAFEPNATAKHLTIVAELSPEVGVVRADPDRLRQIVWNLLDNAVKFTPSGGRITLSATREGDAIEIRVSDTGLGISPDFLPDVFDRFRQADPSLTRTAGGLGLGLAIVKQLVELHGGTVAAESDGDDKGSTFIVRLPLPRVPAATPAIVTPPDPSALRGVKILIAEDDEATRYGLASLLKGAGARVVAVASATAAIESFQREKPELIVSDIGMPDLDGYALLRQIRTMEAVTKAAPVPAVALTAFARDEDRRTALESGYQQHIPKPVDPEELLAVLVTVLRQR